VSIALDGTVFYSYLAESPTYCSNGAGAILLAHSVDKGVSFRGPVVVDSNPADDRPTIAVESIAGRPSHIFVAWTRSFTGRDQIWYSRSVDGGANFSPPLRLYTSAFTNFGAIPVVGPNGHVYVSWLTHTNAAVAAPSTAQVLLAASVDDGAHFAAVHNVGRTFSTLPQLGQPGGLRDLTALTAAVAPTGALYIAYAAVLAKHADGSVDAVIVLRQSLDHGLTWSLPEFVNDAGNGDRFMPALAVLADGTLGVAFYDRRAGGSQLDVYAARASFAGGFRASQNVRANSVSSPIADIASVHNSNSCFPAGRFFGDYIGTAAVGNQMAVVWADAQRQAKGDTDIWFARLSLPGLPARVVPATPHGHSGSFISWLTGIFGHIPTGGMSRGQLIIVAIVLLLPGLSVAIFLVEILRRPKEPA
jgi:hypothetical protein